MNSQPISRLRLLPLAAAFALLPGTALAQDGQLDVAESGDTAWVLAATALVMFMAIPGLALFYAGRAREKAMLSVMTQCGAIAAVTSIAWIVAGYTLGFGDVTGGWLGSGNAWMLITLGNVREGTGVPESAFVLFQMAIAMLAPMLMAGAWVGRARFGWVVGFCALWSLVVYAPVAHWIWGGGWLFAGVGTLDWAGGLVVQTTAGISALVVTVVLGKRKDGVGLPERPHSPALTLIGAALLWVGWLGLCGGWALQASDDAAAAMIATHAAAASAALVWLLIERFTKGKSSATGFATGAVAGLATVSPAAGYISPGAAILVGALGSAACCFTVRFMTRRIQIDDTLNVFAVSGVGGVLGALLLGPFLSPTLGGVGYGEGMNMIAQTVAQGVGVVIVVVWSVIATVILALMVSMIVPMRVSENAEREGLDLSGHGERGWEFD